ncbi:MAG: ImmA/IrrE family metallo-endopeptidase [Terriglobales bacterium]
MAAIELRRDHNIQAIEDIPAAAQRAGCQISYVDLPTKVSGFAQVIEGTPHIVVNRAKSLSHTRFTIAHELGHHQLHLNPSRNNDQAAQLPNTAAEFEANTFATILVATTTSGERQEQMLAHNPEMQSTAVVSLFATLVVILMAVVIWICSRLFGSPDPALIQTT